MRLSNRNDGLIFPIMKLIEMSDLQTKRVAIIHHFFHGKKACEIFKVLKNTGISRELIHRTIKRYTETGSTLDRK